MKAKFEFRGFVLLMLIAFCTSLLGIAEVRTKAHDKLSPEFHGSLPHGHVNVIVQYRRPPTAQHYARVSRLGGTTNAQLHVIRGAAFRLPSSAIAELAKDPDVAYISPDRPVRAFLSNAAPAINAPYAWGLGYDGTGISVAVVDSGISGHDDLKDASGHNRIVYQANFASDAGTADAYGHGEHVAVLIAGTGKDSTCSNCYSLIRGV